MKFIEIFIWLFFVSIIQASKLKFGFILVDEDEVLNERFVIFGSTSRSLSLNEKSIINDEMNTFYRFHRKYLQQQGLKGRLTISTKLESRGTLPNGNLLIALKGEMSEFLKFLRYSLLNVFGVADIWKEVKFYSDPVLILSREDFMKCDKEF